MIKNIYRRLRDGFFKARRLAGFEKQQILLGEIRAWQIAQSKKLDNLSDAEFSVFSQWGEDGIISWLVSVIQPQSRTFIEFGVEDFRESNLRYLLQSKNWSGLIIDGSEANIASIKKDEISYKFDLTSVASFIDRDNINSLISGNQFGDRVGILSVDIDGVDYWVLEKITIAADIIIVEYNDYFGNEPLSVPYDAQFVRREKHPSGMYWGASLAAFSHLLEARGYSFLGTNSVGTNAFFVANKHSDLFVSKLEKRISWPCKMREARNLDGTLAYRRYDEMGSAIRDLPLVNVSTNVTSSLNEVYKNA